MPLGLTFQEHNLFKKTIVARRATKYGIFDVDRKCFAHVGVELLMVFKLPA